MNFIFISPHFPKHYWQFCDRLHKNGVNVLGIGDCPYDELQDGLKGALTEYYYLPHLDDYEQMLRAVAFFTFKYGKIDWIESNNEFWLEQDARLRTDFHVTTGEQSDNIRRIKNKSAMKAYYAKAGVPTARLHKVTDENAARAFIAEVGYPVIVKPDVASVPAIRTNCHRMRILRRSLHSARPSRTSWRNSSRGISARTMPSSTRSRSRCSSR